MTSDVVPWIHFAQQRTFGRLPKKEPAAFGHAVGTARVEATSGRGLAKVRRRARDPAESQQRSGDRREGLKKSLCVWMLRIRPEPLGRCDLDDLACVHDRDPVRELEQQR